MKIQDQVCSPELATRLMELGVNEKHKSHFCYSISTKKKGVYVLYFRPNLKYPILTERVFGKGDQVAAILVGCIDCEAYTVAELGEILPIEIMLESSLRKCYKLYCWRSPEDSRWNIEYRPLIAGPYLHAIRNANEANARAKMLIYLIENKLIEL